MSDDIGNPEAERKGYPFLRMREIPKLTWLVAFFLAIPKLGSLVIDVIKAQYYRFSSEETQLEYYEPDRNPIKRYEMTGFMRGQYNTELSKQISMAKVKKYAKSKGVTINDVMHAVVSVSLKKFFVYLGDDKTNKISFVVSFTFKQAPELVKDYKYNNDVQDCYYTMNLK